LGESTVGRQRHGVEVKCVPVLLPLWTDRRRAVDSTVLNLTFRLLLDVFVLSGYH
jgi:hypothetical protein